MSQLTLADISEALKLAVVNRAFQMKTKSADPVERISVARAAPAGEGLLGAVYRINAAGKYISTSFVVKALITDQVLRNALNCPKYFKKEIIFFSTILPVLLEVQTLLGAKENLQNFIPICFEWHCDGSNDYLILDDLAEKGLKGLSKHPSIEERNATIKTIAHIHAVSFATSFKNPDAFSKITDNVCESYYCEENREFYDDFLKCAIRIDTAALAEYENPKTSLYYEKFIQVINEDVYSQLIDLVSERGDYPVLCHGDAWCSNFFYGDGRSVAIDFQLLRYASPATDLSYFILVSNLCRDKEDFMDAIEIYYQALQYYLADMKLDVNKLFPRSSLEREIKKYGKFGLLASLTSFVLLANDRCDTLQPFGADRVANARIPLTKLWPLNNFQTEIDKIQLVNAVRVAVDVGLI